MDWCLYDRDLGEERFNKSYIIKEQVKSNKKFLLQSGANSFLKVGDNT